MKTGRKLLIYLSLYIAAILLYFVGAIFIFKKIGPSCLLYLFAATVIAKKICKKRVAKIPAFVSEDGDDFT